MRWLAGAAAAVPERAYVMAGGRRLAIAVRVNPRARSIAIRIPGDGRPPRLTLPSAALLARGLAFAQDRAGWIAGRIDQQAVLARPFRPGTRVPVAGQPLLLVAGTGRAVRRIGDRLEAGDDLALFPARVQRWLVAEARRLLARETDALAAAHGLRASAVRVGDPRSRWGSCTTAGRIAYSWRLLLAPDCVRAAVVAHEVAHLMHHDHGPHFWALAEHLLGASHAPARAWLRRHGPALHGWGVQPPAGCSEG